MTSATARRSAAARVLDARDVLLTRVEAAAPESVATLDRWATQGIAPQPEEQRELARARALRHGLGRRPQDDESGWRK